MSINRSVTAIVSRQPVSVVGVSVTGLSGLVCVSAQAVAAAG